MAAPEGNQFWRLRSKHGRDKLFTSPQLLWEAACDYFEWCEKNPLIDIDYKGKDADRVELPKMVAFTIHGLCIYLGCNTAYFRQFKASLKDKKVKKQGKENEDFSTVITRIEEVIYNQKFIGAAAGFLNPNIIARDLGLVDKKEVDKTETVMTSAERDAKIRELLDKATK
ncbi:DNA-packaging protein [Chryseobacterium proteolyticum]|uniref:DNA-packaging protein n=1 Tax=Chryseobacterium proteolyticum TaxID=118127 RepID=UPI0039837852